MGLQNGTEIGFILTSVVSYFTRYRPAIPHETQTRRARARARAVLPDRTVSQFYFTEAPAHSCPLGKQTSVYRVTVSRYCTIPGARARARRQAPHSCGKTDATMRDADLLKMPDAKVKNRTTTLNNDS